MNHEAYTPYVLQVFVLYYEMTYIHCINISYDVLSTEYSTTLLSTTVLLYKKLDILLHVDLNVKRVCVSERKSICIRICFILQNGYGILRACPPVALNVDKWSDETKSEQKLRKMSENSTPPVGPDLFRY